MNNDVDLQNTETEAGKKPSQLLTECRIFKVVGACKVRKRLHGLELQIVEYRREISKASLRQVSETFTVSFMSYRPANVLVFFGKKSTIVE